MSKRHPDHRADPRYTGSVKIVMFYNLHFNKASGLLHTKTLSCSDLTITTETGHNSQFLQCFHFSIGFYQLEMISCIARNGKLELNIYFQFQKFSLITSQKLNICTAAKMKHSPNIKNQNLNFSTKYTESWIEEKTLQELRMLSPSLFIRGSHCKC